MQKQMATSTLFVGYLLCFVRGMAKTCTKFPNVNSISASFNGSIRSICKESSLNEAVHMLHCIHNNVHSSTYVYLLQCCLQKKALHHGKRIHALIVNRNERRLSEDIFLQNAVLSMYAKCGSLLDARTLFDEMIERDVFSWNVMISAYRREGFCEEALAFFHEMQSNNGGVQPNEFIFASVIPACSSSASLEEGIDLHRKIIRSGFQSDVAVMNALVDMYSKFRNMHKARVLFDKMKDRNTISWTAMITGYAQNGYLHEAEKLFKEMHHKDTISWTAMIAGYAQNGCLEEADKLFKKMSKKNTILWNAMISGYAQNGHGLESLKLFQNMQLTDLRPDSTTFGSVLPVCATFAALERGVEIHGQIIRNGFLSHVIVVNALIDMYAKCGSIQKARVLFDKMHFRNTTSWSAMIAGYAMHGCGKEAIKLFEQMEKLGISPNHVTLINVLSACSHAGLVNEGFKYFKSMNEYYHIIPAMEHYACMVDLLGRAGHLDEAKDFIINMPIKPDADVWTCLLGACRIHNNLKLAEFITEHLIELDPQNVETYVLISNIYAMSGRWYEIKNVRKMMKDRGIQKIPGCSWIEVNRQVHTFVVGDRSQPKPQEIDANFERLSWEMKAAVCS